MARCQRAIPLLVKESSLSAQADGRTRTRQAKKGNKKQGQQRQGYHTDWKEPKLFTLYAIDETGRKLNKQLLPYHDGTITGRDSFKQLFKMYLYKTGIVAASQIIFIGDGAPWIWNIIDEIITELNINPHIVAKVLDFYHAAEQLWKVIDALPNLSQKQKQRLFKKSRTQLKKGNIDSLIETLGRKANRHQAAYRKLSYFHGHEDKSPRGTGVVMINLSKTTFRLAAARLKVP